MNAKEAIEIVRNPSKYGGYGDVHEAARVLAEIVNAMPRTADDVPIVPGMTVYPEMLADWEAPDGTIVPDDGGIVESFTRVRIRDTQGEKGPNTIELDEDEMEGLFSSREAVLAARKEHA